MRRTKGATARTLDPVFSHIDVFDTFCFFREDWNTEAFGSGSIFERWDQINGVVVNINLPELIASQLHYIERRCRVPYRYDKTFEGRVEDCDRIAANIKYTYYVRSLDENPQWDRDWIAQYLREQGVLREAEWLGVPVRWFHAQAAREVLEDAIAESPRFLLGEV